MEVIDVAGLSESYKVIDFSNLKKINDKSIRLNFNRTIDQKFLMKLDALKLYPITFRMIHNDDHMRCQITFDNKGHTLWLDMEFKDYNKLKTIKIPLVTEEEEQNEIDKNVKLNRELYLQNQKANPDDTI
jgi:hypothetical protein